MAALNGAEVTACDLAESRLDVAKQLGAARVIGSKDSIESYFDQFDVIYETSGAAVALALCIRLAASKGKIVILGLPGKDQPIPIDLVVRKGAANQGFADLHGRISKNPGHIKKWAYPNESVDNRKSATG